jgi:hypothetical protein
LNFGPGSKSLLKVLAMIENSIREKIENPEKLESLYQADKEGFEQAFFNIYTEISPSKVAEFWKARLEYDHPQVGKFTFDRKDILFMVLTCIFSGILIKIPQLFDINLKEYFFYEKNAALIVFLGLSVYAFLNKEHISKKALMISAGAFLIAAIYINLLPSLKESNSIMLAYLHLPLYFWCVYGLIYTNYDTKDKMKRIDYIKYNGDLAILSGLILIAGGILAAVTINLFLAIDLKIDEFYLQYIGVWGLVSAPVVATYVIRNYPSVTNKIAPIIATIFSPLVLITLFIYLISLPFAGKDPYNDRNFLLIFNIMLLGVMGIIIFSISETSIHKKQKFNELIVSGIVVMTLIIDLVALSAIIYRVGEFGFTPNRTAVLGSNILIFCNLILIMRDLYRVNFQKRDIRQVELTIAGYLPIYAAWTILVVFGFPLIFGLK